jgi:hypothetical protein
MSDAVLFVAIFGGLFALRIAAATLVFLCILPEGDKCPNCDAVTIRVQSAGWNHLMPWFRTSWCYECGWDGLLRRTPIAPQVPTSTRVSPPTARRTARSRGHEST